jgi:hypothetical protein
MGLIKKKTAIRGSEGGVKYVCDMWWVVAPGRADITR